MTKYRVLLDKERVGYLDPVSEAPYGTPLKDIPSILGFFCGYCEIDKMSEEYVYIVSVDGNYVPQALFEVSHGVANASFFRGREIFQRLMLCGAKRFFACHNHTVDSAFPSGNDFVQTYALRKLGELMGIPLLDHLIVSQEEYYSFAEHGWPERQEDAEEKAQ